MWPAIRAARRISPALKLPAGACAVRLEIAPGFRPAPDPFQKLKIAVLALDLH